MVVAFEGWNDAAESASGVIDHLIDVWDAEQIAEIDPDDYYDFQVNRPFVGITESGERGITWPTTRVYVARPVGSERDIVLVRGIEPNMRWRQFSEELLVIADWLGVRMVVTLGALLTDTPHTRPVPVTGSISDPGLLDRLDLEESRYEGPTGINGVFADMCARSGIPNTSLWAAVPHYVGQPPCPKATLALLGRLEDVFELTIPEGDLPEEARAWERGVDELASEDGEIAEYVESLEEARDTTDLPEASGDAIAREFERYLKRRSGDGSDG
ncbi:PAC2 family protein [Solicola gregarius]|uniref:PAC2 family protein n=1 Tax=Solicola gregarius TaxID=2908642 RepID=A0AA46TMB3_9ACTN|nr:PAC2 family protein [Solicola gregarius]UYM07921.1 PAC2 family protein [Solicola gregarius]